MGRYNGLGGLSSSFGAPLFQRIILSSTTFIAPFKGNYLFAAIGGGGSGGCGGSFGFATGGSAGGLAVKIVPLEAGASVTIVVGAGGPSASAVTNVTSPGNPGGQTTATGPGVALIANGGLGGLVSTASTGTLNPPSGGTASGGDMNVTGGSPDGIALGSTKSSTSGAAVGVYGFTPPNTTVSADGAGWGGGSVLGTAGVANLATLSGTGELRFGGRYSVHARYYQGPGRVIYSSSTRPTSYINPTDYDYGTQFLGGNLLCPIGLGGTIPQNIIELDLYYSNGQPGAGGAWINGVHNGTAGVGGMYAGGSSSLYGGTNGITTAKSGGILGGGGGGIASGTDDRGTMYSGRGGVGGVIVQFLGA